MKRKLTLACILLVLVVASLIVIQLGGTSSFDMIGFGLVFVRMTAWLLMVAFYYPIIAALGDDDLEKDWSRINAGNTAVSLYRGVEFAVVGVAALMLVYKI